MRGLVDSRNKPPRRQNFGLPALRHAPALPASKVIVRLQYIRISIAHAACPAPAQITAVVGLVRKLQKAYELTGATRQMAHARNCGWMSRRMREARSLDGEFSA